ncbi:MAG: DUF2721 domain-containing protein [Gammaproteobacteria bacterium]
MNPPAVAAIAHAIELAVAPVFLLAGVGAILSVLAQRLGRIIDRARVLHGRLYEGIATDHADILAELGILDRRMRVVNVAITLCTVCALSICAVIAVLFLGSFVRVPLGPLVAGFFVAAMACLTVALLAFLVEIYLATVKLSIRR